MTTKQNVAQMQELTDEDAMNIGRSLMEAIRDNRPGYSWLDSPTEIVADLLNEINDLKKPVPPPKGNIRVPLQPTSSMLRAGTDVASLGVSESTTWDFLSRAWPVMVAKFAEDSKLIPGIRDDVRELIVFLNELAETDPVAMGNLVNHRVECNNGILMHPTVQCGDGTVGMLGILNGYVGKFRSGAREGWGPIVAVMDIHEKPGQVLAFQFVAETSACLNDKAVLQWIRHEA